MPYRFGGVYIKELDGNLRLNPSPHKYPVFDDLVASLGSRHWERDGWEPRARESRGWSYCYGNNVVSLQINTAGIMAMNRVDRIVLERTSVPVQPVRVCGSQCPSLSKGCTN